MSVGEWSNENNITLRQLEQKTKLLEEMKINFGKEFGMNKHLRKQLNEKYAKFEPQIKQLFIATDDENLTFLQNHAKH